MKKKDFVSIRDWSTDELNELLRTARAMKADPGKYSRKLEGKALAMIFEKPSLRTRVSFDVGIHQLGGFSTLLTRDEINLGKRETISDVAKNLERMVQGIMIRTFGHENVEKMAEFASIPVINGLTDFSHPCQAMADFMTIQEVKGRLKGIRIAYVGDGNNVAHSLMYAAALLGANLAVATPEGYEPNPDVAKWASANAGAAGGRLEVVRDPVAAVSGADVVYTDVWASMGQESEAGKRQEDFRAYQVNAALVAHAKPDYVFMHCLPAHRGEEVAESVIDSPHSIVFQQAENRLHAQKAILFTLMA
ncbi:MAG: ornithine carbamoyltransferase [Acidobacteriota bacterium]|jgi:ornithine carbamoyltransferase|nr:ornithine carbamoyltransferase [Acidobacteriota bacterium]